MIKKLSKFKFPIYYVYKFHLHIVENFQCERASFVLLVYLSCRLDLDFCKSRLRKARSVDGQSSVSIVDTILLILWVCVAMWLSKHCT